MTTTHLDTANGLIRSHHVTLRAPPGGCVRTQARTLFGELAERIREDHIAPLQEKVYGPAAHVDTVLEVRRDVFTAAGLDADLPCTYTAGRQSEDLGLAGVQLWGVTAAPEAPLRVSTVRTPDGIAGRLLEAPDLRLLHLFAVHGNPGDEGLRVGVADQAQRMFQNADRALREQGFSFRHVVRTWIYLARLLDWYGEFNRVRTRFFESLGMTDDATFPASTGIQGTDGVGECLMDLLAVEGPAARVQAITDSSRQQRPMSYGSSFSRGLRLRCGDEDTVFVSGTASINATGQTLHCWQREAQVLETLLSVAALLEDQGAGLADVRLATLFCKDLETVDVFERVTRQLGITELPIIPVLADVCRPELMVEIEAMAVVPTTGEAKTR